jgi:glycosyltransferase involved in cell wall biosynthesis
MLKNSNKIWFVNIGEPLPLNGNRPHRMSAWKNQLESEGFETLFFTTDFEHQRKLWIKNAPKDYILLKSFISYKKNVSISRLINHFLISISLYISFKKQEVKPNYIIVSYPTIWLSLFSLIYGKINNIKVIVDVRDKWPDIFVLNPLLYILMWPLFIIKKIIFKYADKLIAISPGYYNWALPNIENCQESIIPLSLPEVLKQNRSISLNKPINFIFVGTLGTTYNLEMLLTIHDALLKENISFKIFVCGDGPKKTWLENNVSKRHNIEIFGWLNKYELDEKLKNAHFGLMLYSDSAPQGWPNKLIEYMANGLPIINNLVGESWELIEKQQVGININSNDLPNLINWIGSLLKNNLLYVNCVNRNYDTHQQYFTDKSNLQKLLNLI